MSINPTFYSEEVKSIANIEFSIYRNKDVKQYSAVSNDPFGIDLAESYENYEPKKGGLVDLRLGTCDIYLPCSTCGENSLDCPGHFGHTELAEPVFHFGFLNHLKNLLQCVCLKCSNLLVEKSDVQFKKALGKKAESRFKELKNMTKNVTFCFQCGVPVPKIKREVKDNGSIKIMIERDVNVGASNEKEEFNVGKKIKESLSPRDCYNILRNVSDNDCYLLGLNPKMQRPEDLIIEKFPIPPVIIRPTAKVDFMSAATMEDSLTLKISDIITSNKRVRQQMEKETVSNELSNYNQDIFNLLQYHVATYFDNESVSLPRTEFKTGGRTTKSISDRIKGKHGRIRSNLMGKRVDFSARSVITSDPYIDIDQVGVPKKIAMELTIPEEVTPFNIKYLTGLVKNGRDVYPGANFVLRISNHNGKSDIQKIDLKYRKKAIKLNFGDVVERHAVDGDYVLFNRQPTLHKPSMMGHKIQVIDDDELNTLRVNVSVCKPYNADFDGDEMNIHLAQSIQARNEIKRIANVQYQIVGVKDSSPIIGCQQDTLSGAYMLTDPSVKIMGWEAANILSNTTSETKTDIKLNQTYSGHEVFSHIIPVGINSTKKSGDKINFQITDGKLITGFLDKSSLSFAKNSIIHFIWDKFGPNKTKRFIDDSQRLVLNYLLMRGQTVGFKDILIDKQMHDQIQQIVRQKILESKYAITQYENDTDQISLETIENSLVGELGAIQANVGQMLMAHLTNKNFFWVSAKSGAKGNATNVAQVSGVIGQNNVNGARFRKNIQGRSTIYWHQNDDTPEARGFIVNSYVSGISVIEFTYNAAAGREGLIDTAVKSVTWSTLIIIQTKHGQEIVKIGQWIDNLLDSNASDVIHEPTENLEILNFDPSSDQVFIPTMNSTGRVSWELITGVTRHDPGTTLYKFITQSGREVTVTAGKSMLVWSKIFAQWKEQLSTDIKIGDCVPSTINLKPFDNDIIEPDQIDNSIFEQEYFTEESAYLVVGKLAQNGIFCTIKNSDGKIKLSKADQSGKWVQINDVVLDPIVQIQTIPGSVHRKMYDLTVPSTLNFGLANGLQVRDTAQTGYVQRQLVKGLEDICIRYDGTNRNARGIVIQLTFGENGINQSTQTELQLNILTMSNKVLKQTLTMSSEQISQIEKKLAIGRKELETANNNLEIKLIKLRNELRSLQSKSLINYKILEEKFMLPVNFFRITQDYSNNKAHIELDPKYIEESIEKFLTSYDNRLITTLKPSDKFMQRDDRSLKFLLEVAINEYLAPVKCIFEYGLTKRQFDKMMEEITLAFIKSICEPGEMVGITAAQSIGEPTSQMSIHKDTPIKIQIVNKLTNTVQIQTRIMGEFCDQIIKSLPELTYGTGHPSSVETDVSSGDIEYYVIGVDSKEKTNWNKISHVSRHPVNGKLQLVKTLSGRSVITTLEHSHLARVNHTVRPIRGGDLIVGMRIPVCKYIPETNLTLVPGTHLNLLPGTHLNLSTSKIRLDAQFGWFIGLFYSRGVLSNNKIQIINVPKYLISNINLQLTSKLKIYTSTNSTYDSSHVDIQLENPLVVELIKTNFGFETNHWSCPQSINPTIFSTPESFKAGFIRGYFDSNNNVQFTPRNSILIELTHQSEQFIRDMGLLLNYFDILSLVNQPNKLAISTYYFEQYKKLIGSDHELLIEFKHDLNDQTNGNDFEQIDQFESMDQVINQILTKLALYPNIKLRGSGPIYRPELLKILKAIRSTTDHQIHSEILKEEIELIEQAVYSGVVWDPIVSIEQYLGDQTEWVYDFTVGSGQTFMVESGIIVHNTLNTKHFAGAVKGGTANMGVSRIQELLHYTKTKNIKTPQMMIYFKPDYAKDRSAVNKIVSYFKYLSIRQLISNAEILYDVGHDDELGRIIRADNVQTPFFVNNQKADIGSLPFVFRLKFNLEKMLEKETSLLDIKTKFISHWYKNYTNFKNLSKNEKEVISRISRCAILSNNSTDKEQIIHIRFSMSSFNYNIITDFLKMIFDNITLKGIENIEGVDIVNERVIKFSQETGEVLVEKEYMVYTSGINFDKIRMIQGIDLSRTKSNDVATTLRLYGIEATRQILLHELAETYKAGGSNINHNHLSVLVDQMCHLGEITSMDRHGLSKIDIDPIARASFEESMDHFITAALFNEKDSMRSVSSRIAVGRVINGGTGAFDILLDTKKLEASEYTEDETGGRITFTPLEEDPMILDLLKYDINKDNFYNPLHTKHTPKIKK
jgi:DNA-directed RNA polymerase beta' subunit